MRTPKFIQLIESVTAHRNPPPAVCERLFFGYSQPYDRWDGLRCWQGALVRADLGSAALGGRLRYHLFLSETDQHSGAFINTVEADAEPIPGGGHFTVPGLCEGDNAILYSDGRLDVVVQGLVLLPAEPRLRE